MLLAGIIKFREVKGRGGLQKASSANFMDLMDLKQRYETKYICSQIERVVGRRYNIRPDLNQDEAPEVSGYMYKETAAGFFRAWVLNEINFGILCIVNELRIAEKEMIFARTGMDRKEFETILYKCIAYGILCENNIIFKSGKMLQLYLVDTGGIFALEEAGKPYLKVPFTISIDERISIYRRNLFILENGVTDGETTNLQFFENIIGADDLGKYTKTVLILDMSIAEALEIKEPLEKLLVQLVNQHKLKLYDLSKKEFMF